MKKLKGESIMELAKKSKIVIAVVTILIIAITVAIVVGIAVWKRTHILPPGNANLTVRHEMTAKEAKFVSEVLPITLLLPKDIDGDITFNYGSLGYYEGINKDKLAKIKEYAEYNDSSKLNADDFKYFNNCEMTIKKEKYMMKYVIYYMNNECEAPKIFYSDNNKSQEYFDIYCTYYLDMDTNILIDVYPLDYNYKLGDTDWRYLTKEEKIELYGREWFDSVELSDIDEFMKEVCAYNGINSDWLDNKPVYNIK